LLRVKEIGLFVINLWRQDQWKMGETIWRTTGHSKYAKDKRESTRPLRNKRERAKYLNLK